MKQWALVLALVFLASIAHAATFQPTVNPLVPVQNSPLSSLPVRNNFQSTYNDLVSVAALISGGGGGGSGTVTSVSCSGTAPATCSVANATTTPSVNFTFPEQGNGSKFQLSTGSTTTNDIAIYDASGNVIDGGSTISSLSVTWPAAHSLVVSNSTNSPVGLSGSTGQVLQFNTGADPTAVSTLPSAVQLNITQLGTVTTGTWNGAVIGTSFLPVATSGANGILRPDNSTITISGGVISAPGSGGGTVNTGNINQAAFYTTTGTAVSGAPLLLTTSGSVSALTNAYYDTAASGNTLKINGTAVSAVTGSGSVTLATTPTFGTNITDPLVIGGTGAGSTLTLESTSGSGTTDAIIFKTASQTEAMRLTTTQSLGVGTQTPSSLLNVHGGSFIDDPSTLTISTATFTPTTVGSNTFRVVLIHASCPCTIANPSGTDIDGQRFILEIWQSATGSDTVSFGNKYDFGTAGAPTLSTGASKGDILGFSYSAQNSKYNYIGVQQGM